MARLSDGKLAELKAYAPSYDRQGVDVGIVHLGPGAFHRAHQADYTDRALSISGGDWGICAVSLNSTTALEQLSPQDGLYTLAIKDQASSYRIIGCVKEVLCARKTPEIVLERLTDAKVSIVTLTITEKGYALTSNGRLDIDNPAIAYDLKFEGLPKSAIGYLVKACELRRENSLSPLTLISCDNLPHNGDKLKQACLDFAQHISNELAIYIEANVRFPNTMVDSITPATTEQVTADVAKHLGVEDFGPVQRESFVQWVIEDNLPDHRPDWAGAGAIITNDVEAFEKTKLRILNGAHSTLTYLGLLAGVETVGDAIAHKDLNEFVHALITQESIPTIDPPEGLDLYAYWSQTRARFENPHIRHLLEQISHDGSQKIPARIFPVIDFHAQGESCADLACFVVAAWIEFNRQRRAAGSPPVDAYLKQIESDLPDSKLEPAEYAEAFLKIASIVPQYISENQLISLSIQGYAHEIAEDGVITALPTRLRSK